MGDTRALQVGGAIVGHEVIVQETGGMSLCVARRRAGVTALGCQFARFACAAIAAFTLLAPASAGAHAVLLNVTPSDEATVDGPVTEVTLKYNERVGVAFGGTKAWGPDGERVDDGTAKERDGGKLVVIPLDATARGTYAISYRIVSADGHPLHGAVTFHIRERSADHTSEDKAREASRANTSIERAFGITRGLALFALLALVGGVIFSAIVAPGARPRFLGIALVVALVTVPVSYVLDAANSGGFSVVETLRWEVLRAEAGTTWGRSALIQVVLLLVAALWLRIIDPAKVRAGAASALVCVPFVAPIMAWSAGGHAIATEPVWLRLPFDTLHMVAAAVWLGGLVQLARYLRSDAISIEHVERWSRAAFVAVVVLVATGLYASWAEIGLSRDAIIDTTYGRLVVAKSLLLLGAMPFAYLNRKHNVPGLRVGHLIDGADPRARLRRYVRGEVAILALVIAATAALIQTPPARTQIQPGLFDSTKDFRSGASVQLVVDPSQQGVNEIHVYLLTKTDRVDSSVTELEATAANAERGIEGLDLRLLPSGPGHWTTPGKSIPFAGTWKVQITAQRGKFDSESATITVPVATRKR